MRSRLLMVLFFSLLVASCQSGPDPLDQSLRDAITREVEETPGGSDRCHELPRLEGSAEAFQGE